MNDYATGYNAGVRETKREHAKEIEQWRSEAQFQADEVVRLRDEVNWLEVMLASSVVELEDVGRQGPHTEMIREHMPHRFSGSVRATVDPDT